MLNIKKLLTKIMQWMANPKITGNTTHTTGWNGSSIPNTAIQRSVIVKDTSERWVGQYTVVVRSEATGEREAGAVETTIGARYPATGVYNNITLTVNPDGSMLYTVSSPSKFRSAIEAQQTLSVSSSIDIASYIRSSTGTFVSGSVRTYGKICMLRIVFKNTNTIGKNGVVYAATISSYRPAQQIIGVGSNGGNPVVCSIDGSGNISARNCGASAAFTDTAISITYLMP